DALSRWLANHGVNVEPSGSSEALAAAAAVPAAQRQVRTVRRNVRRRPDSEPAGAGGININVSDPRTVDRPAEGGGSDIHSASPTEAKSDSDTRRNKRNARDVVRKLQGRDSDINLNQIVINTEVEKKEGGSSTSDLGPATPGPMRAEPGSDRRLPRATPEGPQVAAARTMAPATAEKPPSGKLAPVAAPATATDDVPEAQPAEEEAEPAIRYRRKSPVVQVVVMVGLVTLAMAVVVAAVVML